MTTGIMQELPKGTHFYSPGSTTIELVVTTAAKEHPRGWVFVRHVHMSDHQAAELRAKGGYEEGEDPRDGFFNFSHPVTVELINPS